MTLGIIVWVLLTGLIGLIWVMVLDTLYYDDPSSDKRQGSVSPEPREGYEPLDALPSSQRL